MNLLVDSHALIWSYFAPTKLSRLAQTHMTDPNNRILISPASHWEIASKMSTGKLQLAESFLDFIPHAILDNGYSFLPIEPATAPV